MATIRTFIALDVSKPIRTRLADLQQELAEQASGVKWVGMESYHLTLLFLGDVPTLDTVKICREVQRRAAHHEPYTLEVVGLGGFPNSRRPKVLWAGIGEGADETRALHADLEEGLMGLGCYRREERAFTPHLTLGRLSQDDNTEAWGTLLRERETWSGGAMPITEVLIMASEMRRSGPQYSVIGRAEMG